MIFSAKSYSLYLALWVCMGLAGCTENQPSPSPERQIEKELDIRLEVMHQTRAVLRYMEEEERLQNEHMNQLGIKHQPAENTQVKE